MKFLYLFLFLITVFKQSYATQVTFQKHDNLRVQARCLYKSELNFRRTSANCPGKISDLEIQKKHIIENIKGQLRILDTLCQNFKYTNYKLLSPVDLVLPTPERQRQTKAQLKNICNTIQWDSIWTNVYLKKEQEVSQTKTCLQNYYEALRDIEFEILPYISGMSRRTVDSLIQTQEISKAFGNLSINGLKAIFMQTCRMHGAELGAQACGIMVAPFEVVLKNYTNHNGRIVTEKLGQDLVKTLLAHIPIGGISVGVDKYISGEHKQIIAETITNTVMHSISNETLSKCKKDSICIVKELAKIIPTALVEAVTARVR